MLYGFGWIYFLTPTGALRSAVFISGYPSSAFTMKTRVATAADVFLVELDNPTNSTVYRITENIPYEKATDGDLENWIVYRIGIFYFAKYYGYC